ncbi:MAG: hypothetical protein C4308_02710 [Chitinophagaceae bacterium]
MIEEKFSTPNFLAALLNYSICEAGSQTLYSNLKSEIPNSLISPIFATLKNLNKESYFLIKYQRL